MGSVWDLREAGFSLSRRERCTRASQTFSKCSQFRMDLRPLHESLPVTLFIDFTCHDFKWR